MATEITMPQLGESVTEGTISKWLVKPGDRVNKYDPLAEVLTDKVNAEVPSSFTGTIKELVAEEDETVEVGAVICTIQVDGEVAVQSTATNESTKDEKVISTNIETDKSQKRRYSPAVLKMANDYNIDLEQVSGSGKGGRITRKDLKALIDGGKIPQAGGEQEKKNAAPTSTSKELETVNKDVRENQPVKRASTAISISQGDKEIPVTGVRKAIAANMVKSKHEAPHAWTMVEVDVTRLVNYRNSIKTTFKKNEGYNLTFLPFFIKATVEALKEFPQINSMWAGDKIIQKKDIHISLAVATEDALFVPVIKHADEKNIKGIAREVNELAEKVRTNKISSSDMQGGTFTINNTGSFGSILSAPIINPPQAAILSVESIVKRPVVMEHDMIAIRHMVNLCLSLDHRVLDGLVCGRFLARIKEKLENMNEENTSIY